MNVVYQVFSTNTKKILNLHKKQHRSNIFYCRVHDQLSLFTAERKRRICTHVALSRARNPGARRARLWRHALDRVIVTVSLQQAPQRDATQRTVLAAYV